jgi:hypothetical protein
MYDVCVSLSSMQLLIRERRKLFFIIRTRITVTILGLGNLSVLNVKGLGPLMVF